MPSILNTTALYSGGGVCFADTVKCSAVAEMGDRFATIDIGRKLGALPLFGERGAVSPSNTNTMSVGTRPTSLPSVKTAGCDTYFRQ